MKTWSQRLVSVQEWSAVDKGLIPIAMLLFIYFQYVLWGNYVLSRPDHERLVNPAALQQMIDTMMVFFAGAVVIGISGLWLRNKHRDLVAFQGLSILYFALSLVPTSYFVGTLTLAPGVVLLGGPIFGFIVLDRRWVWVAFIAALALLLGLTYASALGHIPYAPVVHADLDAAGRLFWTNCYLFFAAPHVILIVVLADQALSWWRRREDIITVLSRTDVLTGIHNRRSINYLLEKECARTHRHGPPMCVVLIDLDHFKKINDSWGHPVGDRVLQKTATVLRNTIRECDEVGRYGGEEFMLLLPNTTIAGAERLVERCREGLENINIKSDGGATFSVSASFGLVCNEQCLDLSAEVLIKAADDALYRAKAGGRNRVVSVAMAAKD